MANITGVIPVFENTFKINKAGRTGTDTDMVTIKDMETFQVTVNGKKETWTPLDNGGFERNAITGKGLTIALKGKRNYGDAGNDYIASLLLAVGQACESSFEWTLPSGAKLSFDCVIDLKIPAGGDSTKLDILEFDILCDGKPTFTAAAV